MADNEGGLALWEWGTVLAAAALALALGFANLGAPSLWHDELVHAFVGKAIAETGRAELPSGVPYYSGTTINVILAGVIKLWGMSEAALRTPSVLIAGVNVVLTFFVLRPLLGPATAVIAALAMAVCPWTVAWSREARFYSLQQCLYLVTILAFWRLSEAVGARKAVSKAAAACIAAYVLSILTSFHSILFLGGIGAYAIFMGLWGRRLRSRWTALVGGIGGAGILALVGFAFLMNDLDREAVWERGGLGGQIVDAGRAHRFYYTHWLRLNLSNGFFAMAVFGFAAMLVKEGRRGLYAALAFWAPIIILTFFIGYRRPRFMFFVFPFYVAASSYAMVVLADWLRRPKPDRNHRFGFWIRPVAAALVIVFALRLAYSAALLVGDSLDTASGAHLTLARRHPQWKGPCAYVKAHRDDAVVVTTTYLPALYYVGHVDEWYPSRDVWWEVDESGMAGLEGLEDFQRFAAEHPKGYFIAEWWRFERNVADSPWSDFSEDIAWVQANMTRIDEASSEDVSLYAWGMD